MIRTRTFEWARNSYGPIPGWLPLNAAPGWAPGPGFLTAHDVMEHLSDKADWAHELRAAGVAAYNLPGLKMRSERSLDSIALDIVTFASQDDHDFAVPDAPARWAKPLPSEADETTVRVLGDIIHNLIMDGRDDARRKGMTKAAYNRAPTFSERALPWIRLGYAGAMRVYGKGQGLAAGDLLDRVADAINDDHNKGAPPVKGDKLVVSVDTERKTHTVKRIEGRKLSAQARREEALIEQFSAKLMAIAGGR